MTYGRTPKYRSTQDGKRPNRLKTMAKHFRHGRKPIKLVEAKIDQAPRCPAVRGNLWVLATVEPNREAAAVKALTDTGYPAWYPIATRWMIVGNSKKRVHRPLFPGYVFIGRDGEDNDKPRPATSIPDVKHVMRVLSAAGKWTDVQPKVMVLLDTAQAEGQFDFTPDLNPKTGKPLAKFVKNDRVRVEDGPFAGFPAIVEEATDEDNIKILIEIFGRMTPASATSDQIVSAS